jgi:hypothetical protein
MAKKKVPEEERINLGSKVQPKISEPGPHRGSFSKWKITMIMSNNLSVG